MFFNCKKNRRTKIIKPANSSLIFIDINFTPNYTQLNFILFFQIIFVYFACTHCYSPLRYT